MSVVIYSKMANSVNYAVYTKNDSKLTKVKSIIIRGGADVGKRFNPHSIATYTDMSDPYNTHLVLPVMETVVSNEDFEELKNNKVFQRHLERKMLVIEDKKISMDKAAEKVSKKKDKSALLSSIDDVPGAAKLMGDKNKVVL